MNEIKLQTSYFQYRESYSIKIKQKNDWNELKYNNDKIMKEKSVCVSSEKKGER